ncbi:hypothetical protein Tco_0299181 [Tanacetum coccineum]
MTSNNARKINFPQQRAVGTTSLNMKSKAIGLMMHGPQAKKKNLHNAESENICDVLEKNLVCLLLDLLVVAELLEG